MADRKKREAKKREAKLRVGSLNLRYFDVQLRFTLLASLRLAIFSNLEF
jgi:hypothetical protein